MPLSGPGTSFSRRSFATRSGLWADGVSLARVSPDGSGPRAPGGTQAVTEANSFWAKGERQTVAGGPPASRLETVRLQSSLLRRALSKHAVCSLPRTRLGTHSRTPRWPRPQPLPEGSPGRGPACLGTKGRRSRPCWKPRGWADPVSATGQSEGRPACKAGLGGAGREDPRLGAGSQAGKTYSLLNTFTL